MDHAHPACAEVVKDRTCFQKIRESADKPFSTNMMKLMQFCAFSATKQNLEKLVATPSIWLFKYKIESIVFLTSAQNTVLHVGQLKHLYHMLFVIC